MPIEQSKVQALVDPASELIGSMAGVGCGLLFAGHTGAFIGAAYGPFLSRALKEAFANIHEKLYGKRGPARVGATLFSATTQIRNRVEKGETVRADDFFDEHQGRSHADEVFEGVLIRSRDEYQEEKARHYGGIISSAVLDPSCSPDFLLRALAIANNLTYRQLCILRMYSAPSIHLRSDTYVDVEATTSRPTQELLEEIFDLIKKGILHSPNPDSSESKLQAESTYIMDQFQIVPKTIRHTTHGEKLSQLLSLDDISKESIDKIELLLI